MQRPLLAILLTTVLFIAHPAKSQNSAFADVMKGMITGLALLGQANNSQHNPWLGVPTLSPWPMAPGTMLPGMQPGMMSMYPQALTQLGQIPQTTYPPVPGAYQPYSQNRAAPSKAMQDLQGSWETNNGGLFLVKGNLGRLYLSRDRYQDLQLQADQRYLWMRPAGGYETKRYEHRIFTHKVILRASDGKVLLLKRYQTGQQTP